jgi:hypothetical protein
MDYSLAALKLFCSQLKQAREVPSQHSYTLGGILFQRAWLQVSFLHFFLSLFHFQNAVVFTFFCLSLNRREFLSLPTMAMDLFFSMMEQPSFNSLFPASSVNVNSKPVSS